MKSLAKSLGVAKQKTLKQTGLVEVSEYSPRTLAEIEVFAFPPHPQKEKMFELNIDTVVKCLERQIALVQGFL